jgi:hypothetical protein
VHPELPVRRLAIVAILAGCAHPYVEPAETEPHALVHLRILHHAAPGPRFAFALDLGGESIAVNSTAPLVGAPVTRTVRVRPGPGSWHFGSHFSHLQTSTRLVNELRYESYACGTSMSYGVGGRGYAQPRYCTRSVPYQRWVTETVPVVDGACDTGLMLSPEPGASYVLQYDFFAHARCAARCFRQVPTGPGTFDLLPCGARLPNSSSGGEVPAPPPPAAPRSPGVQLGDPTAE